MTIILGFTLSLLFPLACAIVAIILAVFGLRQWLVHLPRNDLAIVPAVLGCIGCGGAIGFGFLAWFTW